MTKEEAQAGVDHFSPYMEWRGMALEHDFQALTLVEGQELMKDQSQKGTINNIAIDVYLFSIIHCHCIPGLNSLASLILPRK